MRDLVKPTLALLVITLFAALIIGVTYAVTEEPIRTQRANVEMAAVRALLPATYELEEISVPEGTSLTRAAKSFDQWGAHIGYVVFAAPSGYSGRVYVMVAFSHHPLLHIEGVRIINHTETPGLGSQITQDAFLHAFEEVTFAHRALDGWIVPRIVEAGRDVPAIANATISVNAVLRGVNDAIAFMYERGPSAW